jgi:hypothetical protein
MDDDVNIGTSLFRVFPRTLTYQLHVMMSGYGKRWNAVLSLGGTKPSIGATIADNGPYVETVDADKDDDESGLNLTNFQMTNWKKSWPQQ